MKFLLQLAISLLIVFFISSCKKDEIMTDASAKLEFSEDTVMFDTVFTSLGSTTKQLKIYNRNNRPVKIASLYLAGGASSTYRMNVDGIEGKSFTDIIIPEKDSLFIFVEVTVNPNSNQTPFLLLDSLVFNTNGNIQDVDLVAFGQNANFIVANRVIRAGSSFINYALLDTPLNATFTWNDALPYVIWGGYLVVDETQTLIINEGARIYFGNNAGLWVYAGGTLKVDGSLAKPVTFQGLRLEDYYQDVPGQWDRIWINEGSTGNEIDYAVIRNGFIGIQAECLLDTLPPKNLKISNTIIENMSGFGILTRYYNLQAYNCVISRSGQYAAALTQGGKYEFIHCTFANYWNDSQRSTPSIHIDDYVEDQAGTKHKFPLDQADFLNCIVWGNNDEELEIDYGFNSNTHNFKNVILKTELDINTPNFVSVQKNVDPEFADFSEDDYQLLPVSPAKDAGDTGHLIVPEVFSDIKGVNRQAAPDLGAYEIP